MSANKSHEWKDVDAVIGLIRGYRILLTAKGAPKGELKSMLYELIKSDLRKAENDLRAAKYHKAELEKLD